MSFWYIATPYSKFKDGHQAAFEEAAVVAAQLVEAGVVVFSPIVHCHPMQEVNSELGGDWETWMAQDHAMLDVAVGMIVVKMDGWDESKGVAEEIRYVKELGKPILYMEV